MARTTMYLLLAMLVALSSAACGGDGDSREAFEEDLQGAQQELETQFDELGEVSSPEDLSEALDNAAAALREQSDELEDSDVPEEAEDERDQLVESLSSLADDLEQNAEAVGEGNVGDLLENVQDLDFEAVREVQEALDRLREQGFDVDPSS